MWTGCSPTLRLWAIVCLCNAPTCYIWTEKQISFQHCGKMIKSLLLRSKVELRSQRFLRNILTGFVNTHTCSDTFLHRLRDILPNYRLQPPQATESQERCCRWVNMPKRGEKIERKSLSLQFSCTFHYNGLHSEFQLQSFFFFFKASAMSTVQMQQWQFDLSELWML